MAITVGLITLLFIPFFLYMPIEISGNPVGNIPMLVLYNGLLAFTVAALVVFGLMLVTKKEYMKEQLYTFSRFRHLILLMVKHNFITRYRRSVLGILWSVLNPLLTMLIMTLVFSTLFRFEVANFPLYVLSGQLVFGFFSEASSQAMVSITGSGTIIKRIYVPKYIYPLTQVLSGVINIGFALIAFIIVFIFTSQAVSWTVLLIPIPILYTFVFALGIGMLLSSVMVFFRDIGYIYGVGITLWMFLSAIMYPVEILPPRIYHLIHLNPLFHYISFFRDLTLNGTIPGLWANIICIGFALAALCAGVYAVMSQQDKYILYL